MCQDGKRFNGWKRLFIFQNGGEASLTRSSWLSHLTIFMVFSKFQCQHLIDWNACKDVSYGLVRCWVQFSFYLLEFIFPGKIFESDYLCSLRQKALEVCNREQIYEDRWWIEKKKHPKRVIGCLQKKGRTIIIVAFNGFGKDTRDEMLWQAHCSLSFRSYD